MAASAGTSPFRGIHDFFHSTGWYVSRNLALALLVALWAASVVWVVQDARRRIADPWIVAMAAVLAMLPVAGPVLYLLIRPQELLPDARERDFEVRALRQLRGADWCPECGAECEESFRFCPVCATEVKQLCAGCEEPLKRSWHHCPFCATPRPAAAAAEEETLGPAPMFTDLMEAASEAAADPAVQ